MNGRSTPWMRLGALALALLLVTMAGWAYQDESGANGVTEDAKAAVNTAAEVPQAIPAEAKAMRNPSAGDEAALRRGKLLFGSQCSMCHGSTGAGEGDLAERLAIEMPDMTDKKRQGARTDGELFYIISHGHGRMPAETRLADDARWSLVLAVRALGR